MLRKLEERPGLFFLIIGAYFLVNFLVRLSLPHSLELDEAQQSLVSQWFALGYDTQPPFYNWVQYAVTAAIGNSVFALSALKNLFLFSTYALYYLTARLLTKHGGFALVAAFGLLTIPQIAWESQRDLTHSVALIFASTLFFYGFFRALKSGSAIFYALTGLAAGIGLISKYNFAVLVASAVIAALSSPVYRRRLFDPRVLLTIVVAAVVVLPHGLWLLDNIEAATAGTVDKIRSADASGQLGQILSGLGSIVAALAGFAGLTIVIHAIVYGRHLVQGLKASTEDTRLIGRMIVTMIVILAIMVVFTGATSFKERWLSPVLLLLPLYLSLKMEACGYDAGKALRRFLPVALIIMILVPTALFVRVITAGWSGDYQKLNVPYGPFVAAFTAKEGRVPALIVAQDAHLAGNMRLQFPGVPVAARGYSGYLPSFTWTEERPVLLVWRTKENDSAVPDALQDWVGRTLGADAAIVPQALRVPYHFAAEGDAYVFGYAFIEKR